MEKNKRKKIVGTTSLEEALEQFALKSPEYKDTLDLSLKIKELIDQVVHARQYFDMTQRDLAIVTDIKQPMIARIERLESIPRLDTFMKIIDKLDLEIVLSYKTSFNPISFDIRKIKYMNSTFDEGVYKNNQISYGGCVKNDRVPNAA